MSLTLVLVLAGAVLLANGVSWAAFRIDKARARRGARRISERRLLTLAALGGGGALVGMYAHRQRHKVDKRRFRAVVWTFVVLQVVLAGAAVAVAVLV